jgi:uncharacterized protein
MIQSSHPDYSGFAVLPGACPDPHRMLAPWWYPVLFVTAFVAGLVDAIAGGGGLLTIPVLLGAGLPPVVALGTNKLQASFGSTTATWHYSRGGVIAWRDCRAGIAATAIGAAIGAWAVQRLSRAALQLLIPWLLAAILVYMISRPNIGTGHHPPRVKVVPFFVGAGLALGFYDGFFGPGVGSFWTIAIVLALGWSLLPATGATKLMNCTSNLVSLAVFLAGGQVRFGAGLTMAAGQILGSRLGARLALQKGARLVRPVFLAIVALTVVKLLFDLVTR